MRKHLITGGAGFIGYHLAQRLLDAGDEVHLVDDLTRGRLDPSLAALLESDHVRLIRADLSDPRALEAVDSDYNCIYHLAAVLGVRNVMERPDRVLSVNARTVLNVVEWFVGSTAEKLFFASTSEAYAWTMRFHPLPIPTPEEVPLAVDDVRNRRATYAVSKAFGEMAVIHGCERAGKPYAIGRYHNVYGPRMGMEHVVPELYRRIYDGQSPLVVYSVADERAFCYVDDAIDATLSLVAEAEPTGVFNIGNEEGLTSIGQLAQTMLEIAGCGERHIESRQAGVPGIARRSPDTSRIRAAVGYRPRVSLREGLTRTMEAYRADFERTSGGQEDSA